MEYVEQTALARRGAVEPEPAEAVDGVLLVGVRSIASWEEGHCSAGHDEVDIRPAVHDGERMWLVASHWCPARGYSATGTDERLIGFSAGVELLLRRGAFDHLWGSG